VEELPPNVTEGLLHVIVPPVAVAPGAVVFIATIAVAVEIQPFVGLVTVNV
jgi:hypothetical protein